MDYSSLGSGISESLEFLSPPVKRGHGKIGRETKFGKYCHPNNGPLLKDYRRAVSSIHPQLPLCEKTVPSSTSLFLKKTSERQILEQYSVFSYTDLNNSASKRKKCVSTLQNTVPKDRPLIRVSVFPNNTATQTKFRKRRHPKKVQNTSSNQENSIKANNVYLVVAGRKREKIYELKTTESAEQNKRQTYHYHDEEIAVEHNFKQLLTSLNMETVKSKKKKKGKKKESLDDDVANPGNTPVDSNMYISNSFEKPHIINDCTCPFTEKFENNGRQHKNRQSLVKLIGKIGLTEDENYAATVDDRPIKKCYPRCGIQYNINRNQKDSTVQVDMGNLNNRPTTCKYRSIETQCTPANFESICFPNVDKLKIFSKNEEVYPCSCERNDSSEINHLKSDYIAPKGKPSPLVIISVYPKQNNKDDNEKSVERKSSPERLNSKERTGRIQTRSPSPAKYNKPSRSRSPSPAKGSPKRKGETSKTETRKQRKNKESPDRSNQAISNKKQQKDKPIVDKGTKTNKTIPQAKSPTNKKQQSKSKKSSTPQGTNVEANVYYYTDSMLAKKALVEAYTKKITAQMNTKKPMQWVGAKNDASNIAVNINSENEFYDVLLRQGRLVTDLTVRKTIKERDSEYGASDDDNHSDNNVSASLENFLLQDKHRKRSFSQTFLLNDKTGEVINKPASRINVRDSIELSHRREYNSDHDQSSKSKSISTSTNNEDNLLFLAPIKHYKGDSCNLPNPVERDKEIRELLGIDKGRPGPSRTTEEPGTANSDRSLHCLYYTRCHNDLLSGEEGSLCNFFKDEELLRTIPNCECDEEQKNEVNEDSKESDSQNESDQSDSTPPTKQPSNRQNKPPSKAPSKKSKHQVKYPKDKVSKDEYLERQDVGKYTPTNKDGREPLKKSLSRNDTFTDGPLYQQLILNRNINVYLQIEKFTKQKPIVLSHKQYAKVKKTILSASKKSRKTKMCICKKTSSVSIGEVRRKSDKISKPKPLEPASREKSQKLKQPPKPDSDDEEYDESHKQDRKSCCPCDDNSTKTDKKSKNSRIECLCYDAENTKERIKQSKPTLPRRSLSIQREVRSTSASFKIEKLPKAKKSKMQTARNPKEEILSNETPDYRRCDCCGNLQRIQCDICGKFIMKPCSNCGAYPYNVIQFNTRCYCANETRNKSVFTDFRGNNSINPFKCMEATVNSRKASSSTEIHYTSVAYMKHVTFSSTNVKIPLSPISKYANNYYNSDSLHTIFKGHRKSATPNLGTSEFSLYSDNSEQSHKLSPEKQDVKPRKPFLRRLMSCLVMRSRTSDIKLGKPQHKVPTVNSSVDSYHISTSLGAIELSSSIYDTSASFYSNHTILPVNSKMKRSFLSSVRGFLTNRRS